MNKINRDTWIQLVGMWSVVAGLIFVGVELRQSQRLALAGQQQQRAVMTSDWVHSITEQGEDLYYLISADFSQLSDEQKKLARNIVWFQWNRIENDYYQYSLRLLPEEKWNAQLSSLALWKNACHARDIYDFRYTFFESDLKEILDSTPNNCP
tara:strand:- start:32 stop:490 length:459 start_codon:yes stop_codon:yes gene_type:complete